MVALVMMQSGGGGLAGAFGNFGTLPLLLVFFAAMYFLTIAPNQKKQKAWQQMLAELKPGDRVTTSGGLRGMVLQVKEEVVILRIQPDNLKLEFVKSAIATVVTEDAKDDRA